MPRTPNQIERLRTRVAALHGWYHVIDLGDDVVTPGPFDMARHLEHYGIPADLGGLSVLDVGCANGFFSVECVARGAREVVALDVPGWLFRDWNPAFRTRFVERTNESERRAVDEIAIRGTFGLVVDELGQGRVRRVDATAYELDPTVRGHFDLVLCTSVLMHLRDPLLALQRMRAVCANNGLLIVSTSIARDLGDAPTARFVGQPEVCNFWQMSPECLRRMLVCADFVPDGDGHDFVLRDRCTGLVPATGIDGQPIDPTAVPGSGCFEDPHFVCQARPVRSEEAERR